VAILTVPNVVEITAYGQVSGRPWASVWAMSNGAGVQIGASMDELVRDFANNFQDHITPILTNNVSISGFRYVSLNSPDGQTGEVAPDQTKPTVGNSTNAASPPNITFLVHKRIAGGRGTRSGRAYLPGVGESQVSAAGTFGAADLDFFNNHLQDFLDGLSEGTDLDNESARNLVVVHRPPAARAPGTAVVAGSASRITSLSMDPMVATQRRRLR
jgi:hypothetical protein